MNSLSQRFRQARAALQKRHALARLLYGGLAATALLLVFAGLNRWSPIREQNAFVLLAVVAVIFLGYIGWTVWRVWRRPLPLPELAARVEEKHPEWMDALICATELEQKPESTRRPLEQTLVKRMRRESATVDFQKTLIPPRWQNRSLLGALVALIVLTVCFGTTGFFQKARFHIADLLNGEATGLLVRPGDAEAPVRTDVTITAEVRRWEKDPVIEYIDATGQYRFPMNPGDTEHNFTFYDVGDSVRYRVLTSSLESPWHVISTFVPPEIDAIRIRVTPPAYTGLPVEEFTELRDLEAVQGSQIEWQLTSPTATTAALKTGEASLALHRAANGEFALALPLSKSFTGRFVIEDADSHAAHTAAFDVHAQPDLPPTIEITQPGRDTEAPPSAQVPLTALSADDFGLAEIALHVSISGRREPAVTIFSNESADRITERQIQAALDLPALEAVEGDVVVYFLTATDNRQPEPQTTRSEIFFIKVREEVVPEEMDGQPMELEEIDMQALILEMKRLIRLSWESTTTSDPDLEREIATGLEEVRLESARVQQAIIDQAGEEAAAPLVDLMNRSMQNMEAASRLVDQRLVRDAIPYEEMALADLVAIETEFLKNQTTSKEPSEGSSGQQSPPPQEMPQDDFLEEMQRLMSEVRNLSDDQAVQNSAMRRLAASGLTSDQQSEFAERQEAMRERAEQIQADLDEMSDTESAARDVAAAASAMANATDQIEANQAQSAARDGDRARASLLSALQSMEGILAAATGNQVAALARQANALAQQQGQAAGASEGLAQSDSPSQEQAAAVRDEQEAIQQQLENLLANLADTANQLRQDHPETARAVAEAAQQVREQNLGGEMSRAGNALLYRQYDRAAEIQQSISENLGELAQSLETSAQGMPSMSTADLQQLLNQLQQAQREVMGMSGQSPEAIAQNLQQMAARVGEGLGQAAEVLEDPTLQALSGQFRLVAQDGQSPGIFRMNDMLLAAARSLEQQIFALEIDRRARLQRQVSEPPEKYRNLVEEYFKNLSETP